MTDKEILEKVIEKAVQGGYVGFNVKSIKEIFIKNKWDFEDEKYSWYYGIIFSSSFAKVFWGERKYSEPQKPNKIVCVGKRFICDLFDYTEKEFINEFGKDKLKELQKNDAVELDWCYVHCYWTNECVNKGWQYHLQQMVLEKEPLKYLEKFL